MLQDDGYPNRPEDKEFIKRELKSFAKYLDKQNIVQNIHAHIWDDIAYWASLESKSDVEKLEGLAFSLLAKFNQYADTNMHETFYSYKPVD